MKIRYPRRPVVRPPSGTPAAVAVEMELRADASGSVQVEFLLNPGDGLAFVAGEELRTALSTRIHLSTTRRRITHRLHVRDRAGGSLRDSPVPLLIRFDPEGGTEHDEWYLQIPPPPRG
jgi:hypothetical protein